MIARLGSTLNQLPKTVAQKAAILGNFRQLRKLPKKRSRPHLTKENLSKMPRWQLLATLGEMEKIGRAGLFSNSPNRLSDSDLGQSATSEIGEIPLNGTPSSDVSTRQQGTTDRLSDLREWAKQSARETSQVASLRDEIAGLLERMTDEQLMLARANLIQILDANQVSILEANSAD